MLLLDKLLSRFGMLVLIGLLCVPVLWPRFGVWEGNLLPVTYNTVVTAETIAFIGDDPVIEIYLDFYKHRNCEFQGLNWYDANGRRLIINFPKNDDSDPTRPVGKQKHAGPWLLFGIEAIKGTRAVVRHKCHFLWYTETLFYPSATKDVSQL